MFQNIVVVFFALGYLGSSNAAHPASESYIGSVDSLINKDLSMEKIMASVQQAGPEFYSKTSAMVAKLLPKFQGQDSFANKVLSQGEFLLRFFEQASNSEASADSSKQAILKAISERVSNFKADSSPADANELLGKAAANISEVDEEIIEEFTTYLWNALDSLKNDQSNAIFKSLAKFDLVVSYYEKAGDKDQKLAADLPKILNALTAEVQLLFDLASVLKNAGN